MLGFDRDQDRTARSLLVEPLENRQMLAGDVDLVGPVASPFVSEISQEVSISQSAEGELTPEGEARPDLVAFAQALTDAGVVFFHADWCPNCTQQKELFEDGQNYLPLVLASNPDHTLNQVAIDEGITSFPTWRFQNGDDVTGVLSLEEISTRSGISIPQDDKPSFVPIGNQTVEIGAPLHIAVDAYDPDDTSLTVTVTSANPNLVEATVLTGNRSLRLTTQNYGDMVFELFEQRAPRPAGRVIDLAESDFYNGLTYHRIIDNFVIQGGDPTGTGGGGSSLGDFDDQFHPDLQHVSTGTLSYAKSSDDTNDSQFFITEGPTRHLDFNHSIFGQLVEGEAIREAISEVPQVPGGNGAIDPTFLANFGPITIQDASVFNDTENSLVMLKAIGNTTGSTTVTITVTDGDGNEFTEVINVNVVGDSVNGTPYLNDLSGVTTTSGTPAQIQLSSVDVEGDAVSYFANRVGAVNYTTTVDQSTGVVTVTPPAGFVGALDVQVGVRAAAGSSATDLQTVTVTVDANATAPTGVDLSSSSDTGASNSDNITSDQNPTFTVTGTTSGATVELLRNGTVIESVTATGATTTITTDGLSSFGNGTFSITARQTVSGSVSDLSAPLTVVYDSAVPAELTRSIPTQAIVGRAYRHDVVHPDEDAGIVYSIPQGPAGLTISSDLGVISWTPTASQVGDQSVTVRMTDPAGNSRDQDFTINVGADDSVELRLQITDLNGNQVSSLALGDEFLVVVDARAPLQPGVASGYLDIFYDPSIAEPVGTATTVAIEVDSNGVETSNNVDQTPFTFGDRFTRLRSGSVAIPGLIDELGAFTLDPPGAQAELVTIRMRAIGPGELIFSSDPADDSGKEIAVHGTDTAIPTSQVAYGNASANVVASYQVSGDIFNFDEDSQNNELDVLANDTILTAGTTLSIAEVGTASLGGTVTINSSGDRVLYTPASNVNGAELFTYTVSDQDGNRQTATATVSIQPVNDAPNAVNDTFDGDPFDSADGTIYDAVGNTTQNAVLQLLENDLSDPDANEDLRITAVGVTSAGGTVSIASSGQHVLYTPPVGFSGTDTFTYTITDRLNGGLEDTATVSVNVVTLNPPPNAVDDSFSLDEDSAETSYDVLANDSPDEEGDTISLNSVGTPSNGGFAVINSVDGNIRYQPAANFFGTETVTYTIIDSGGATNTPATAQATVTFTVANVNDPPLAVNDSVPQVAQSGGAVTIEVLTNDSSGVDPDETLNVTAIDTTGTTGTVTIASDGQSVSYSPDTSFTGTDTFAYTISDPDGETATATVTVEVLEFAPRAFEVDIEMPNNDSLGVLNTLAVALVGTDDFGNAVNATGTIDSGGRVRFENQAPGNYTITVPAVPFLIGGEQPQSISISSGASDGDSTGNTVQLGVLHPSYIAIADWFGSSSQSAFVIAAVPTGGESLFELNAQGVDNAVDPIVSLNDAGDQVTLQDANSSAETVFDITSRSVQVRGSVDGFRLLRVAVPDSFGVAAASTAQGESGQALPAFSALSTLPAEGPTSSAVVLPLGSEADVWSDDENALQPESTISIEPEVSDLVVVRGATSDSSAAPGASAADTGEASEEAEADANDAVFAALGELQ